MLVAAEQLRLGPVEVGLVPAAHVDRRARLARDRVEHVAAVHARDVQRQPLAGAVERGDARELARQCQHRVAPVLRLGTRMRRAPARDDVEPAAALARGHDRAAGPAALHAQHGVESGQPRLGRDRLRAHLLVGHRDELEPGERALTGGEQARGVRGHRDAALHVGGARAEQAIALAPQRPARDRSEREDRVVVAQERDARPPCARERGVHVEAGRRGHELGRHPVARERGRELAGEQVELGVAPLGDSCATQRAMSPTICSRWAAAAS